MIYVLDKQKLKARGNIPFALKKRRRANIVKNQIVCQNFTMRVFSFVPVVFLLAYIEYQILNKLLSDKEYLLVSAILMLFFAMIYFKCSKELFLKKVSYDVQENAIRIKKDKNEILLEATEIQDIQIREVNMYGVAVVRLTICYYSNHKSRTLVFYSRDLEDGQIEEQDVWDFYNKLNKFISYS